jgi:cytochrome P450
LPVKLAVIVPAEKLPLASRATTLLAVLAEVASTDIVTGTEELKKFTYLKMCINESMRLYPPVWSYGRKSMEDDEIMGIPVPQGNNVNIPVLFLHRNPQYWEKPTEFYPEHFEEEAVKQRDKLA